MSSDSSFGSNLTLTIPSSSPVASTQNITGFGGSEISVF